MDNSTKKKLDYSITPFRLTILLAGLVLVGLNEYFGWDIFLIKILVPMAIAFSVLYTQPKQIG
jgi:phage shock protein PspC (stress-responsive transcriptional regulator)